MQQTWIKWEKVLNLGVIILKFCQSIWYQSLDRCRCFLFNRNRFLYGTRLMLWTKKNCVNWVSVSLWSISLHHLTSISNCVWHATERINLIFVFDHCMCECVISQYGSYLRNVSLFLVDASSFIIIWCWSSLSLSF